MTRTALTKGMFNLPLASSLREELLRPCPPDLRGLPHDFPVHHCVGEQAFGTADFFCEPPQARTESAHPAQDLDVAILGWRNKVLQASGRQNAAQCRLCLGPTLSLGLPVSRSCAALLVRLWERSCIDFLRHHLRICLQLHNLFADQVVLICSSQALLEVRVCTFSYRLCVAVRQVILIPRFLTHLVWHGVRKRGKQLLASGLRYCDAHTHTRPNHSEGTHELTAGQANNSFFTCPAGLPLLHMLASLQELLKASCATWAMSGLFVILRSEATSEPGPG